MIRELLEEIEGISENEMKVSQELIFTKEMPMKTLNPYEPHTQIMMKADFYQVEICSEKKIFPKDLPALLEIPETEFLTMEFGKTYETTLFQDEMILKHNHKIPDEITFFLPEEVRKYVRAHQKNKKIKRGKDEKDINC